MFKKILVVDDSKLVSMMVSDILKKNNYDVEVASGGNECLEKLAHSSYDLAIVDYLMPDINGLDVLKEINNKKYELPVIMLTGEGSESIAADAMKLGALDYVVKKDNYSDTILGIIRETTNVCETIFKERRAKHEFREDIEKREPEGYEIEKNRILLVDDSRLVRIVVGDALRNNNYDVDVVSDGNECFEKLADIEYDLIVLDYLMPDIDGLKVLERINAEKYHLPVIILTGVGSEDIAVAAMKAGALDYVAKDIGYIQILPEIIRDNIYIHRGINKIKKHREGVVKVRERVLIVDDSRSLRENIKQALISENYSVDVVSEGNECLKKLEKNKYDLAMIDYHMPNMNGLQLLERIISRNYDLPVIMMTGKGSEEVAVAAMKLGALDYIIKAEGYFELLQESVAKALRMHEMKKEKLILEHTLVQKNKELEQRIDQLRALNEINKEIEDNLDLKSTLTVIVSKISDLLQCSRVTIMLTDTEGSYMHIKAAKGFPESEIEKVKIRIGEDISGYVAKTGEAAYSLDIEKDSRFKRMNKEQYFTKSFICVPLKTRESVIGVINVNNKHNNNVFTIDDQDVLLSISYTAAIAISKSRYCEMLQIAGVTDALTGFYNRKYFYDALSIEIEKVTRYKTNFSLALIDIDDFKMINDTLGHQAGDIVLTEISHLMSTCVRKPDIPCRYGGDEFAFILQQTAIDAAIVVAIKIKSKIDGHRFTHSALKDFKPTVSIGLVECKKKIPLEELIESADKALYMAKEKGKNTYATFNQQV